MAINLSRQELMIPLDKINQYSVKVYGVGSVGSHFVLALAKTGFSSIEVFDMDIVEEENIGPQAFMFEHLGMNKVDAVADFVKRSAGVDITATHGEITEETDIMPEANTIYCCFFDSFEARKLIYDKIKDYPVIFVDGRIGRFDMRHYLVNLGNDEENKRYGETLEVTANAELACGEKASAPINYQLAGLMVMNIVNYISEKDYSDIMILNAQAPKTSMYSIIRVTPDE